MKARKSDISSEWDFFVPHKQVLYFILCYFFCLAGNHILTTAIFNRKVLGRGGCDDDNSSIRIRTGQLCLVLDFDQAPIESTLHVYGHRDPSCVVPS